MSIRNCTVEHPVHILLCLMFIFSLGWIADGLISTALADAIETHNTEATEKLKILSENMKEDSLSQITELLEAGADVDVRNKNSVTSLFIASQNGHTEIVKLLLGAGANANAASNNGNTPLIEASYNGHIEIVNQLLNAGADVNAAANDGYTPIMLAPQSGHTEIVNLLLNAGADVNAASDNGYTPIIQASGYGHTEIVNQLLKAGADVNAAESKYGATPLNYAAQEGHIEIINLLLTAGADVNAASNNGYTPLMTASQEGHAEVVKLLLTADADVNAATNDGYTPLMIASKYGHIEIVNLLIKADTDMKISASDGRTSIMVASDRGHTEIVKLLLKAGANGDMLEWYKKIDPLSASEMQEYLKGHSNSKDTDEIRLRIELLEAVAGMKAGTRKLGTVIPFKHFQPRWKAWQKKGRSGMLGYSAWKKGNGVMLGVMSMRTDSIQFDKFGDWPIAPTLEGSIIAFQTEQQKMRWLNNVIFVSAKDETLYFGVLNNHGLVHLKGKGKCILPDGTELILENQ